MIRKPEVGEYRDYFQRYIDLAPDIDAREVLKSNHQEVYDFFASIPEEKHNYRYAENKWTPKEVLMHIIDTDRVMSYRALVAARGDDKSPLPSVDENLYAANVDVSDRNMADLLREFTAVRDGLEILFEYMTESQSAFKGNGAGHPITARALAFIIPGHATHHVKVVQERYL
jgi:uncharacterized damage-inducible protein DinB